MERRFGRSALREYASERRLQFRDGSGSTIDLNFDFGGHGSRLLESFVVCASVGSEAA